MKKSDVRGRAVHRCGTKRIDRRLGTHVSWEYQVKALMDPTDGPEWVPIPETDTRDWPEMGWDLEGSQS